MLKRWPVALCFLFMVSLFSGGAAAKETGPDTITWLVLDLPPFFLTKGPDKGKGIADQIQQMVCERLKGYRSRTQRANASRIARELREDNHVCFAGEFYGNPDFLTSAPTIAIIPHAIVVRKDDIERFGGGDKVSLKALLRKKDLILGTAKDRLYGPELDEVLKAHSGEDQIYSRSGEDILDGLLGMLLKKRIDYLIEYPMSIRYAAKKAGVADRIAVIPIQENSEAPLIRGAIRCPDTEWGREVIADINRVLWDLRPSPRYRDIVSEWAVPRGMEEAYWKAYQDQVLDVKE
jgi:uncharacterized protein (TIGR02285 family)